MAMYSNILLIFVCCLSIASPIKMRQFKIMNQFFQLFADLKLFSFPGLEKFDAFVQAN